MTTGAWATLGIAPTTDVRAIRSAYAAILKTFDVDQDQARFARLREAREVALRLARSLEDPVGEPMAADVPNEAAMAPTSAMPDPEPSPPMSHEDAEIDAHYSALVGLLTSDGSRLPDAAKQEAMLGHFRALLADPRLEQLSFRAGAEEQFIHLLVNTTPQSDPLLNEAIDAFGWRQRAGQLSQPQIVDSLIIYADDTPNRWRQIDAADKYRVELEKPDHEHHKAWIDLTADSDASSDRRPVRAKQAHALLATISQYFAPLLQELNAERVEFWEDKYARGQKLKQKAVSVGMFFLFAGMVALRVFGPETLHTPAQRASVFTPPTMSIPLSNFISDVAPALALALPDTKIEAVREANPSLYNALLTRWTDAKRQNVTATEFNDATLVWLRARFGENISRASLPDISEYRKIELKRLKILQRQGANACTDYITGKIRAPALDPADESGLAKLEARLLLTAPVVDADADSRSRTYTVPGKLVSAVRDRTGLSAKALSAAMNGEGPTAAICTARIALVEEALKLPAKTGLTLLRAM